MGWYLVEIKCDKIIFDIVNMLKNEDELKVYVSHRVSQPNQAPLQLEYVPNVSDNEVGEEHLNSINEGDASSPNFQPSTLKFSSNPPDETPPSNIPSKSFDPTIDEDPSNDDLEDNSELEGNTSRDSDVNSDVHQEYIDIRASKRYFNRSQRRSRGTTDVHVNVGEKSPDIGYDESNIGTRDSLVGKLGGEPYYLSDEAPSFEFSDEGFYVCFHALKKAFFGGSRRLIGLDGCFLKGIEGRRVFWKIAKSTFEVELKENIEAMMMLGRDCLDDLCGTIWIHGAKDTLKSIENMMLWTTIWLELLLVEEEGEQGEVVQVIQLEYLTSKRLPYNFYILFVHPGKPSRRVISSGAKVTKRSDIVTGDIGYTPRQGFKWKGKSAITNRNLERMRAKKVIQTSSAAVTKTQGKNISTRKTHVP
ncbi:hypothetical protein FXO37_17309 [Capsicum annuum]|nr:hypothetical protein FXO37_17309 [Capsicum annuum]